MVGKIHYGKRSNVQNYFLKHDFFSFKECVYYENK